MKTTQESQGGPFVAWTDTDGFGTSNALGMARRSCEGHLRVTLETIEPFVGPPAVEGIVIYDRLERGVAVASLLGKEGRTLPRTSAGEACDGLFDQDDLCRETNGNFVFAKVHEGSRAMLVTLAQDPNRRLLLLHRREALFLDPMGRGDDPQLGLAALGLLAHEMGHARDYADGRPGRPSMAEIEARCKPGHAEAMYAIADMALAEYVATRAECAAQMAFCGANAIDLTRRAEQMGRAELAIPALTSPPLEGIDLEQRKLDLGHVGYVVGTLAAYSHAASPVMGKDGTLGDYTSADQVAGNVPRGSALGALLKAAGPALERAATHPTAQTRSELVGALESSLVAALAKAQARSRPTEKKTSAGREDR